jgi:hypothetical protein
VFYNMDVSITSMLFVLSLKKNVLVQTFAESPVALPMMSFRSNPLAQTISERCGQERPCLRIPKRNQFSSTEV